MKKELPAPETIRPSTHRETHAEFSQMASCTVTYITRTGGGSPRFPSDKIRLGYGTVTKAEYDRQWEKLSETA